jgi:hypothetical protein
MPRKSASPASARAAIAASRSAGYLAGSAVGRLFDKYTPQASAEAFAKWRVMPETMLFIDVLRELARNPAIVLPETDSYEVQFGVTSGLQEAAALLDDPSQIFTKLFTARTPAGPAPDTADDGAPDGPGEAEA